MVRINRVYTRAGDAGQTTVVGGQRVSKASLRVEAYGTVDECNSIIGLGLAALAESPAGPELAPILSRVQNEMFNLGAELSTPDEQRRERGPHIEARHVTALEAEIDRFNQDLPELTSFVLPGGTWPAAYLHLARTSCRRAERLAVALHEDGQPIGGQVIPYLNRLSDALFVFARWAAWKEGADEPLWRPEEA